MAEITTHVRPCGAAVWVGARSGIEELHKVSSVVGVTAAECIHVDNLGIMLLSKGSDLGDAKSRRYATLTVVVVEAVNLISAAFLRS